MTLITIADNAKYITTDQGYYCASHFDSMFTKGDKQALTFIEGTVKPNYDEFCSYCEADVESMSYAQCLEAIVQPRLDDTDLEYLFHIAAKIMIIESAEDFGQDTNS